jgi:predicted Rossmann fold nucleotide-binding protein DprA/Smf involved in DNA uptake
MNQPLGVLQPGHPAYPSELGPEGPTLYARGDLSLLERRRIGVFSSMRASGTAILQAIKWARAMTDNGIAAIGGFHAPLEQECLGLFLRNGVPVIVCVAREIAAYRVPPAWGEAINAGKLLVLSSSAQSRRMTRQSSLERNELVVALADEVAVLHAEPGSNTERLARECASRGKMVRSP